MSDTTPRPSPKGFVPADDDTFVIPDALPAVLHPRRGGLPGPPVTLDEDAVASVRRRVAELRSEVDFVLDSAESSHDLVEAARVRLQGEADPRGAAVLAAIVSEAISWREKFALQTFADAWIAEHGIVFAATAAAELCGVFVDGYGYNEDKSRRHVRSRRESDRGSTWGGKGWSEAVGVAQRVRAFLAVAGDEDYARAVEALAEYRRDDIQRCAAAYLVPTQTEWVDELCAAERSEMDARNWDMVLCSVGSAEQLAVLRAHEQRWWWLSGARLGTVLDGVGTAILPVLTDLLDERDRLARDVLDTLAALPFDEAFAALVRHLPERQVHAAVIEGARRFPVRALRLLGAAVAAGPSEAASYAGRVLRDHVAAHPELTAAVLPSVPDEVRAVVASIGEHTAEWALEAPPEALPPLLVEPPWTRERSTARPVVVKGLVAPAEAFVVWAPGERQEWSAMAADGPAPDWAADTDWDVTVQQFRNGALRPASEPELFLFGPEESVRPLLAQWRPGRLPETDGAWMKGVVARFAEDAVPAALDLAQSQPATAAEVLLPLSDGGTAELMADWLARRKTARPLVLRWLDRHPAAAARALVPAALGKAGKRRRTAEAALRLLGSAGHRAEAVHAARGYGDKAAAAVEALLAADPLEDLPATMPDAPHWLDPHLLPQVLLRADGRALPVPAVRHLVTMLALSMPDEVYAGVEVVKELCEPASLAAFAWALFERSGLREESGGAGVHAWVLTALGLLGDDETVRLFTPVIRAWPGEGSHHKAVAGLDALVAIGTDVALMHLNGIAQKVKYKGIRAKAQEKIAALAAGLGLSPQELGDRLVPDLGLDAAGSLVLDYGPRRFVIGFDEQLKPYVADADGRRLKSLPKPGVRDDQELAPAAHQRFATLKKDARTVAAEQVHRLEQAMVTQRRWPAAEFQDLIVRHPLLWHIARRLVWIAQDGDGGESVAFRIAEDRTLADVDDDSLTLPDTARIGIAHPLHLAGALTTWSEVFADYEILQPFPQLGRPAYALTDDERVATELKRFHDITVPVGKLLGLERRGWQRGTAEDNGVQGWISRVTSDGRAVVVDLDPGIVVGSPDYWEEQTIRRVWLHNGTRLSWGTDSTALPLRALDPVTASEVLADLADLTAPTG
ncbi:DUF4132 domain-containing protein [Streptomyces sp. NPDC048483]|uniref:DUF4132 domain-containing protein n=1 Tax=Streptomyces sp. NPDC048483 TaxID=3154927 RepID=UPI0034304BBD